MKTIPFLTLIILSLNSLAMSNLLLNWTITDDYTVRFSGNGAEGNFYDLEGSIQFTPNALEVAQMDVRIAVATIDTGNKTKDKHAKGGSWLDAAQYPYIRFVSERFRQTKEGYVVDGKLSLKGVTKQLSIPFTFNDNSNGKVFAGEFTINRQDYGIRGPWLAALTVSDVITVSLRVPVQ